MATRIDPYNGFTFSVELDGITRAGFRECSGLQNSQNVSTYREGTDRYLSPRKIPGMVTYGDITLSRGITSDTKLWEWRLKTVRGDVERHNISVSVLDDAGAAKITWNLFEAWPTSWTGPSFNATSDEFAIEQITIAYERLEVDQWS